MIQITVVVKNYHLPRGVQVVWSALAIHFLFMGVSSVTGKMAAAKQLSGKPEPLHARLCVN